MRFLVAISNLNPEPAHIRLDYRGRFISLMKKVFGTEEFSQEKPRPYTFAVYFGKNAKIIDGHFAGIKDIKLRFSTGDSVVGVKFYNGILRLKKKGYIHNIGTGRFKIELIREEKEKPITGVFKTLSPVIVERIGFNDSKNPKERYITPSEPNFEESLLENIIRRYRTIKGKEPSINSFRFEPIQIKEEVLKHYEGVVRGFIGSFRIVSDSEEILRFIYLYGLGLRTGQGFGYLEVEDGKTNL